MRFSCLLFAALLCFLSPLAAQNPKTFEYRLLATTRTSTLEREMNQAADGGYMFAGLVGGKEALVVMVKAEGPAAAVKRRYKFLATTRTSTMGKELQQAGDEGFAYRDIAVYRKEVTVVLERAADAPTTRIEYKLLATTRTGTMQKELLAAGEAGYTFRGAAFGSEVLSILDRMAK